MIERTVKNPHRLVDVGEYFAAGLFDDGSDSVAQSFAKGLSQWATHLTLPEYDGGDLYPHGPSFWDQSDMAVGWFYVCATPLKTDVYDRKLATADDEEKRALEAMADLWRAYEFPGGYTHSIPNYRRALAEGLDGFQTRMESGAKEASANRESARSEFYGAMETTLNTAHILHRRVVALLELAVTTDDQSETNRLRLLDAYSRVPFGTPQTFFDALVSTNFLFYLDGCDDLGRFDQYLRSFFEADVNLGLLEHDEAVRLVRAQWKNVDDSTSWNAAIGGVDTEGSDLSSDLTEICLEAARGMRRPNLALRLGPSTPENVWQSAMDTVESGCGLPALYWDPNYYAAMDSSEIPIPVDEKHEYAFGGCTELMVDGKSNVGSLDGDLNLPEVLFQTISNHLSRSEDFEQFYRAYQADLNSAVETLTSLINTWQECKSKWHPQPIRSLLIDDCIDTGVEYSNGGARYNWSVINVMGLANAVDSLSAIKKLVFDEAEVSGQGITDALAADFEGYEELRVRLERAPRYGNGDPDPDKIANQLSSFVFENLLGRTAWRGGPFVPSCLMFTTYAWFGRAVGATPDGRLAGEPIADSAGPYQGRDTHGPTAMLRSTANLDQSHAPGTLVVNIRLARSHFQSTSQREKLRALVESYFALGGLQLQINVIDQAMLESAVEHPERYGDLVVRVGGYSEYWRNLEPALRQSVLLRTEH